MSMGPFVTCAAICEQVIEGKDNVLSAIRLVDTVTLTLSAVKPGETPPTDPHGVPGRATAFVVEFTLLIVLKSGDFRGRGKVRVQINLPSGKTAGVKEVDVELAGEEKGQNIILRGNLPPQNGLYWFDVYFDDRLLSRAPLAVRIVASDSETTIGDQPGPTPGTR